MCFADRVPNGSAKRPLTLVKAASRALWQRAPVTRAAPAKSAAAPTRASNIAAFERLFRKSAGLDIDKADIKRYEGFVQHKIYDLLLRGVASAKANGRDVVRPTDLPITTGLQQNIHEFRRLDGELALQPILEQLGLRSALDLPYDEETEGTLPAVAGGLSVALANCFRIIYPDLKNPQTIHWEVAVRVFDQLL
jgi:hypothetical protein